MVEITTVRIAEELTNDGVTLIVVSIGYPHVLGLEKMTGSRINGFYKHQAARLLRHIKKRILPEAATQHTLALTKSSSFKPFEISSTFTVSFSSNDILSIYRDVHIRAGNQRVTERIGETFCLKSGWFYELEAFFLPDTNFRKILIKNAAKSAADQQKSGTHKYFENFAKLIRKNFSRRNFYIANEGLSIFFDQLTIAPRAEGIPAFTLEFSEEFGPVLPAHTKTSVWKFR
ncbi:MAG: RsiV family protein [Oscillospiraceae bacterium]|nr:RsiV family protein [Oscillospiraceae bacterium]